MFLVLLLLLFVVVRCLPLLWRLLMLRDAEVFAIAKLCHRTVTAPSSFSIDPALPQVHRHTAKCVVCCSFFIVCCWLLCCLLFHCCLLCCSFLIACCLLFIFICSKLVVCCWLLLLFVVHFLFVFDGLSSR